MLRAVADTHAVIWYVFNDPRLSPVAKSLLESAAINGDEIGFSTTTFVEIIYLIEKGRIPPTTLAELLQLVSDNDSVLVELSVNREIALAVQQVPRVEVPDMPDRIIAATALQLGVPLISRDRRIRLSAVATVW
ncbi:MAG: type II toxin-antitoxin system VapC family toxin [Chloroflexota bacterium]|nr:type II toxin-antitoxin system VapC family toxin [Chloroflexota bacterium]